MAEKGQQKQQKKKHKIHAAAQRKRAAYWTVGRADKNKIRRAERQYVSSGGMDKASERFLAKHAPNTVLAKISPVRLAEIRDKREAKKAAAALKPENRERRRTNEALRKKRQAARRGDLKALEWLEENDFPVWRIKNEAHLSSQALNGSPIAAVILEENYPETYKAIKGKIKIAKAEGKAEE